MNSGAFAQRDPASGRIDARQLARKAEALKKYNQCSARAMRYFRACSSNMTRSCDTVYHGKLNRCRGLYL